jgi:hypothetical protein
MTIAGNNGIVTLQASHFFAIRELTEYFICKTSTISISPVQETPTFRIVQCSDENNVKILGEQN